LEEEVWKMASWAEYFIWRGFWLMRKNAAYGDIAFWGLNRDVYGLL